MTDGNVQLWTNQAVSDEVREQLIEDLREVLNITNTNVMYQRSHYVPEFIQIVLEAVEWITPLKVASGFFLYHLGKFLSSFEKKLGEKAAESVWDNREEIKEKLRDKTTRPLQKVANAIVRAKHSISSRGQVRIGLPFPDDHFGTMIYVEGKDEISVAATIALFVVNAEELERVVKEANQDGQIFGGVQVEFNSEGGLTASWYDQNSIMHSIQLKSPDSYNDTLNT